MYLWSLYVDLQMFDLFIYDYDHDVFKGEICH